jgi:hypothetical protein
LESYMKAIFVAVLALTLSASYACAQTAAPLTPGQPAGVHQAQLQGGTGMLVVAGAALVGITVALATAGGGAQPAQPTTTSSSVTTTGTSP